MISIVPFIGWLFSGCLKFLINYVRFGQKAKEMVGNGGFPSTHTTIVVSTLTVIGLKDGIYSDLFGLGVCVCVIIIIDALGIRKALGHHARSINNLNKIFSVADKNHREKQGHTKLEVLGGAVFGVLIGCAYFLILNQFFL
ncbi:divergent PAP2 family protein [Paenibacillus sp. USDA918EY]|uniref:divergent PAP2 family protein n=1 Tax=Paenibacillus sp. USDA918EY TaxID=2689575 RepID=UPI001357499C|nr:divergent PAP2 family protein [Paenibacillus sp. USDA918EY]